MDIYFRHLKTAQDMKTTCLQNKFFLRGMSCKTYSEKTSFPKNFLQKNLNSNVILNKILNTYVCTYLNISQFVLFSENDIDIKITVN